jgi:hypothetical protein
MKNTRYTTIVAAGIILTGLFNACTKKSDNSGTPINPYTTSAGGALTDSVTGELGDANASVIYNVKGSGHGLSFNCYDQTFMSTDTTYADVTIFFAYTKADLLAGNFKDTLSPTKSSYQSKKFGIQDSMYIKVVKDAYASNGNQTGKFSLKVIQNILPIESAETIALNGTNYTLVQETTKPTGSNYYEKWYKVAATAGKTYYIPYITSVQDSTGTYTLNTLNCKFYDKDGVTNHDGSLLSPAGNYYISYMLPLGQNYLYFKCYTNTVNGGTVGIKVVDAKPY